MTHVRLSFVATAVVAVFVLAAGAAGAQGSAAEPADDALDGAAHGLRPPRPAGRLGQQQRHATAAAGDSRRSRAPHRRGLAAIRSRAEELFALDADDAAFGDSVFTAALNEVESFSSRDTATGNYNQFWMVERDWDNRTSLIVDPPNGRIPERTQAARMRAETASMKRQRHAIWTDDRSLGERCQSFGAPRLGAGYNSYYQLFQTPDHVVILMEMAHDARIIPLDGRPHLDDGVRSGSATLAATGTATRWSSRPATTRPSRTRWAQPSTWKSRSASPGRATTFCSTR